MIAQGKREQKKKLNITEIVIPKYAEVFNKDIKHLILTSGRAGTKSSFVGIKGDYTIVADSNASVVVLRKHHNKLRKTVYKEMLRGIGRLQIPKRKFDITVSPMEIRYKKTGSTIYFAGSDGIDDTKGIIDEEKPIKLVILDELTEFFEDGEGEDELQNIEATFVRGNIGGFQMIYLYNPPKNPNAPINKWCRKMEKRSDCLHLHTDYRDVPPDWLGPDLIASAEMLREADPKQYRWVWLGIPVGVDEVIYYMFSDRHKALPTDKYRVVGIGGDYGQQNATTYQAFGLNEREHRLEGLGEYYWSGRDSGKQKSPSDYAEAFVDFANEIVEKYSVHEIYLFLDPSAAGLMEEIRRRKGDVRASVHLRKAENDVKLGISRVQKLLTFDMLFVSPEQENLIDEIGTYEYDKKSIERGEEKPVKVADHCMDALRYMCMGMWKHVKRYIPETEKEYVYRPSLYHNDEVEDE